MFKKYVRTAKNRNDLRRDELFLTPFGKLREALLQSRNYKPGFSRFKRIP